MQSSLKRASMLTSDNKRLGRLLCFYLHASDINCKNVSSLRLGEYKVIALYNIIISANQYLFNFFLYHQYIKLHLFRF